MPPYTPPNPPALIQPVAPQSVSDRSSSSHGTKQLAQVNKIEVVSPTSGSEGSILLPISSPTAEDRSSNQTTPSVVEFYYANPNEIPLSQSPNRSATTEKSAVILGTPISVGQDSPEQNTPNRDSFSPQQNWVESSQILDSSVANFQTQTSPQTLVLQGLNQSRSNLKTGGAKVLITQERGGEVREFQWPEVSPDIESSPTPTQEAQPSTPAPANLPQETISVVEVVADHQEYDQQQQVITAHGNVIMRFAQAILTAERLQVNLTSRLAVADGKEVTLKRGNQVLRGNRFEYYFVQDKGLILNANGEIYQPTFASDFSPGLSTGTGSSTITDQPLSDRLVARQPLQSITSPGGYQFSAGSTRDFALIGESGSDSDSATTQSGGQINRLRFQAERVNFYPGGWDAINVRLTNDPFSPPELEVRADTAKFRNIEPLVDELTTTNSRLVLDQGFSPPIFQDRLVFDRRPRQPGLIQFKFDGDDRGGLFVQRPFAIIDTQAVLFQITPQYLIQKAFFPESFNLPPRLANNDGPFNPSVFGLKTDLDIKFAPRTTFVATANLPSLDFDFFEDNLRAKVRLQQKIGDLGLPHLLNIDYNYRERLFNGSLGFQTVESSFGATVISPEITLGDTGINLRYQAGIQNINSETDIQTLIDQNEGDNIVNLTRYQGAAVISRNFSLWQGQTLPPTPEEGLRYSPVPVQPYLQITTALTGVTSYYSNGDAQPSLTGSIGLQGQLGHFSRPYLDYTGFNITYAQGIRGSESPFKFDRFVDTQTLSLGVTQQIYGPVRVGFQSSFSLNKDEDISTDYFLEYSRRTYSVILRYNPTLSIGSFNLKINDFNWLGDPDPFDGSGIRPVIQGVEQ